MQNNYNMGLLPSVAKTGGNMRFKKKKQIELTEEQKEEIRIKDFFDRILPSTIKFLTDHYIVGDSYRCVWAIKEYPPTTEELALFSQLADRNNLTVRLYSRLVDALEQRKIIQNATRRNKLSTGSNDAVENITAEGNLQDVVTLIAELRKNKEPLLHCAVYLELKAESMQKLRELQSDIIMELTRSKMSVDRLTLRQKEGFLSVLPCGANMFKEQFERVLPASSVANLYPFNYSGKTDPKGFFIGRDKYGTNILVDFDRRADDKTNANCLILGNSGQGKSFLMKLILTNLRESGKRIISLDPEAEYEELIKALGGCYIDFMSGEYIINPLEPKSFGEADKEYDQFTPEAFRRVTRLSQHIAYLKNFFRAYKEFNDEQLDTLEIILTKLYKNFGITDYTDYDKLSKTDYPIMSDLYELLEKEYKGYQHNQKNIYREKTLQELCLGLHSMCIGTESKYFNGHTNIVDDKFLCFGVKGLMDTNRRLKDAMLFNALSYMTNELLGKGNTVAAIDELYLFLTNMTAIEYIRNASKRVRKKDSSVILASQNIDDFLIDGVKEYTKPLFSIPTHQFLFNAGNIEPKVYIDTMQLEQSEFDLIKYPERGTCLYRCGNERYLLQVIAPEFKQKMFGKAGGR
jgi:type IV secretory pathway VirB4 component